ncbi:cytochrome P450 [Mycena latifolia]|nr:cytochrome P450 [Mycena latifolia]
MSPSSHWNPCLDYLPHWWLGLALFALLLGFWSLRCRTDLPTPPGPRISVFGLGKGVAMPARFSGDLIFLNVLRNPILVINSVQVAQDLLEKRSAIYSSRPIRVMQKDVQVIFFPHRSLLIYFTRMGFDFLFTGMKYDAWYKQHRTMFITTSSATTTAAIVLEICYGIHVADAGDEYVALADQALAGISSSGNFGTFAVDYFPLLHPGLAPGRGLQTRGSQVAAAVEPMFNYAFDSVKQKLEEGCAEPSVMTIELESLFRDAPKKSRAVERETIIKDVVATTYAAGSDTVFAQLFLKPCLDLSPKTLSTLLTFVLAMVLHPAVQEKAWAELDRVVPKDRLPSFEDRDQLPYIACIAWECLRWQPPVNIALGHYLTETDEYMGYRIPKGTTCLANMWAMLHDPQHYPDPSKFDPDRYIDAEANRSKNINANPEIAFGFGRRICPGRFLALDTIWIVITSTLYSYRICKAVDERGKEVEPLLEYTTGLISIDHSLARPFKYRIVSRGESTEKLVEATINQEA